MHSSKLNARRKYVTVNHETSFWTRSEPGGLLCRSLEINKDALHKRSRLTRTLKASDYVAKESRT